jgi:pilus assembly protein CpaF
MTASPARPTTPTPTWNRDELRKRAVVRVTERVDPARSRHKPISLVRQEARRVVDQFLDTEAAVLARSDRESLIDDVLADVPGLGPLDELFRDAAVFEFMILAHNRIIRRHEGAWLPTSVTFRDEEHYRRSLTRMIESADASRSVADGGYDVNLLNGFRLIAILAPSVMDQSPLASFSRLPSVNPSASVATPPPRVATAPSSGSIPFSDRSGAISFNGKPSAATGASTNRMLDPWDRAKIRITERFVQRLAANGVYDLSTIASPDLKRILSAMIVEANDAEKLHMDHLAQERMALEILAHMNR